MASLLLGDGYLSPDTGAKVAALDAMVQRGDHSPDLGWWAREWDPDGSLHPYFAVRQFGNSFVAVTTLPMLYLARPLYAVGGHHAALLVPMLGGVLSAFAAGALARRLGGKGSAAAAAVWVTGIAGPVAVYALSFWEHTFGLALMAWGAVWVLDVANDEARWRAALWSGLAYGAAATMRQEALVYGAVAGLVVVCSGLARRRLVPAARAGLAFAAGVVVPTAANLMLESAVLGSPLRSGRSAETLAAAGSDLGARFEAALVTFAAPISSGDLFGVVLTGCLLAALPLTIWAALTGRRTVLASGVLTAVITFSAIFQWAVGPAFVPGLIAASPLAGAGLVVIASRAAWRRQPVVVAALLALGPLPLVWTVQYATSGAWPQWGGRYILLTGLILAVIAIVVLADASPPPVLRALIVANALVTVLGLGTLIQRSHEYAHLAQQLQDRPEEVLVFHDGFLVQEAGVAGMEERWLGASSEKEIREAARVLVDMGVQTLGYLGPDGQTSDPHFAGYNPVGRSWVGQEGGRRVEVVTYEAVRG